MSLSKIIATIFQPRQLQRLEEFPCSICGQQFELTEDLSGVLNGFVDQDLKTLVHHACKRAHYEIKNTTPHHGLYSEMPLTMDDLERFSND